MNKRILTLIISILLLGTAAAAPHKTTYLYAEKDGEKLYLDHYHSSIEGERGCVVFLFGGAFIGGVRNNEAYNDYFEFLTREGWDVVSIDYRLGLKPMTQSDAKPSLRETIGLLNNAVNIAVEDLYSATLFILDNAESWDVNPEKIVISGSSAGAITVLQAENELCNHSSLAAVLPEGFRYAGVISFAGAIFSLRGEPQWAERPAPIMLFHGNSDQQVPFRKAAFLGVGFYGSRYLIGQFDKLSSPYWFYMVKYGTHDLAVTPMRNNLSHIREFLTTFVLRGEHSQRITELSDTAFPKRPTSFKVKDYISANYGN
jgi:dienelactone hydrolase